MYWRWAMTLPGGTFLGDHNAHIDRSEWPYEALTNLYGWIEHHIDSGKGRVASQEEIVAEVGDWVAERLFGGLVQILAQYAPCTVRVTLPETAAELAFMPLELARVSSRPLAVQHVSLVIDLPGVPAASSLPPGPAQQPTGELRVLGLFSLPGSSDPLNLRKERYELERLAEELSGSNRAIKMRTLQYGATREVLAKAVEEGDGWDVIHLAGHGRAGVFVLEKPDGGRDPIEWEELVDLLKPLRHRVKLVTVSSCESGERIGRQQLELLFAGHPIPGTDVDETDGGVPRALASELARQLDCAVVGMRYPVAESFVAAFTYELYRLMFDMGQPLATARALATANTTAGRAGIDRPALSAGVPALYGASAIDLRLTAPQVDKPVAFTHKITKLAGFPDRPAQFVGCGAAMSGAAQALAPRSGHSTIVLQGPAGTGKTALAVELAYSQRDNFADLVWYTAPEDEAAIGNAVGTFSAALEQKIEGLELAPMLGDEAKIRAFSPSLTEFFKSSRILLVIDHADSLLAADGTWRDDLMGLLVQALIGQTGLGRVIVTTRRPIQRLSGDSVLTKLMSVLSAPEAVLLARELTQLRDLLDGVAPPLNEASARGLARQVLDVTHGYPKLLKLAGEKAKDPLELARLALVAKQIWVQHEATDGYLAVLNAWASY
jgi:hypothetical protein